MGKLSRITFSIPGASCKNVHETLFDNLHKMISPQNINIKTYVNLTPSNHNTKSKHL